MGKKKKKNKDHFSLSRTLTEMERHFRNGKFNEVISLCRRTQGKVDETTGESVLSRIYFTWVLSLMKLNRYAEIDEVIEVAEKRLVNFLDLAFFKVRQAKGIGDHEKVITYAEEYLRLHAQTDKETPDYLQRSYKTIDEILWNAGHARLSQNDSEAALEYFQRSLSVNPGSHPHRVELAEILVRLGRGEQAVSLIKEGIAAYPDYLPLKNAFGLILGRVEKYEEGIEYISNILKEHPHDSDALNNLGVIYEKQGLNDLALEKFKEALENNPQNTIARDNIIRLQNIIDDRPQTISAAMIVKNEEKFLPGCLESLQGLVDEIIIVDTGSTDRTIEIARRYGAKVYEHPWQNDFSLHRNQSIDYATGDWILIIDADEELDPAQHEQIKMFLKRKDFDGISFVVLNKIHKGRMGYLHSTRLFRNHKGYHYEGIVHNQLKITGPVRQTEFKIMHYGYGLSEEEMYKKSRRSEALLLKQLEDNPNDLFAHFNLAQLYRGEQQSEKCLEHAKFIIENGSYDDEYYRHIYMMALDQMGCAYTGLRQYKEAEDIFLKALEYHADYLDPIFNIGFVYLEMKQYDEAEKYFRRYLEKKKNYSPAKDKFRVILNNLASEHIAYYAIGYMYFLQEKYDTALEHFKLALNYADDVEIIHYLMARCYRAEHNFGKVIECCYKAVEFGHENWEVKILEGEAHLNSGNAQAARECFNRVLEIKPDEDSALVGLIGSLSMEKDPAELLRYIDEFLEKSPTSPQILASKGDVLFGLGQFQQARQTYLNSRKQNPDDYRVLNNLGNCFLKEQNYASAVDCYQAALTKNGDFVPGYKNMGVALIKQNKPLEAIEYLERYLEKAPNDFEVQAALADLYYNVRDYQNAVIHYEKYLAKNPSSLDALIRLSDCYLNSGKLKSAVLGYQAVLSRDPANKIVIKRLNELNAYLQPVDTK